ncbi:MAG TPA: acetyl-CoA carboxylase biotin carboxylase subunit [bacterium]|nr:acetyl-CoA carboxylase biotin carboxylase subunit [bacterium]
MFKKILIANRGEIALRIIRACKELGVKTVAVYSQADADSLHVHLADESVCIGKAFSKESYLNIPALISAAEITDAEAIHPGYGFLAENAHFAEVCSSCQIKFIGPKPEVIRLMGDKVAAIRTAKAAGAPTTPGSDGPVKDEKQALEVAKRVKYPVIIKASAGGGGKGMRVAHTDLSLTQAFQTARTEAEAAFGNPEVYIEKYIEDPRHIEVQILGDEFGHVMHLGERDCTIQRNHQKLIEEAPSSALTDKMRKKLGKYALKLAKEVKYTSAGTIEFLMDKHGDFYFMEMNTRVQVEHPVTELTTGIDIIKEQIKIAAGERLSIKKDVLEPRGHAIECRINAENPDDGFRPSPGTVTTYHVPGGPGVRVDTHLYQGYKIPPYYDSMLAKIIVHAPTRIEAIKRMLRALDELVVEGVYTTTDFLKVILESDAFKRGHYSTHYVEQFMKNKKDRGGDSQH